MSDPMPCPHCKSTLLWSEDRGPHCDGCDEYEPEEVMSEPSKTPIAAILLAMAHNYKDGHKWDRLDSEACQRAADELTAARADSERLAAALQTSNEFLAMIIDPKSIEKTSSGNAFMWAVKEELKSRKALSAHKALNQKENEL